MLPSNPSDQSEQASVSKPHRYRIGVLLYLRNQDGDVLLIKRSRAPNVGLWCAVGGKLEMDTGESPFECAIREAKEEVGIALSEKDVSLRCILSEENYENTGHWLMFIFEIRCQLSEPPQPIDEGVFSFFKHEELEALSMPPLDKRVLIDRILKEEASALHVLHAGEGVEKEPSLLVEEELIG